MAVTTVPCRFIGRARGGHELIGIALIGDLGSSLAVTIFLDIQHTLAPTLKRYSENWLWGCHEFSIAYPKIRSALPFHVANNF